MILLHCVYFDSDTDHCFLNLAPSFSRNEYLFDGLEEDFIERIMDRFQLFIRSVLHRSYTSE